jgi:hypothetical protein
MHCTHCGRDNHNVENCYHIVKLKCPICNRIGHKEETCHFKKKTQKPHRQKDKLVNDAIALNALKKQLNITEIGFDEETLAAVGNEDCYASYPISSSCASLMLLTYHICTTGLSLLSTGLTSDFAAI